MPAVRAARALRRALLLTLLLTLGVAVTAAAAVSAPIGGKFQVRHVFVIVLENESAAVTFGPDSPAPFLSKTLPAKGAFVPNYYGVGHASLDNYVAMISGQAPNPSTQADCGVFANFTAAGLGSFGQQPGSGCVYPADVTTLPAQLQGAKFSWRDYNEDMGADPTRESATCGHPVVGQPDHTEAATADRHVRHPPRPVRVLPLDHRPRGPLRQPCRQPEAPADGPLACRRHAQLHLHHPRPVRRRPRRHLRQRADRAGCRPPTRSCRRGCRGSPRRRRSKRTACSWSSSMRRRAGTRARAAARSPARRRPSPGAPAPVVGAPAPSSSPRASPPGPSRTRPTTTTRCSAASRTSSALPHLGYAGLPALHVLRHRHLQAPVRAFAPADHRRERGDQRGRQGGTGPSQPRMAGLDQGGDPAGVLPAPGAGPWCLAGDLQAHAAHQLRLHGQPRPDIPVPRSRRQHRRAGEPMVPEHDQRHRDAPPRIALTSR